MKRVESDQAREARASDFLVQFIRLLRVAGVHELENSAVEQVTKEVVRVIEDDFTVFNSLAIQVAGDQVYFNGDFVKLKGAAFEAAGQARRIYQRLAINEINITSALDAAQLKDFLRQFQRSMQSATPTGFAQLKFPHIQVRALDEHHRIGIDQRVALARAYAQLVVILQESVLLLDRKKPLPLQRIRRATQGLAQAAEGNRSLLAGLTRYENHDGDPAFHAAAVGALAMLMGLELKIGRKALMALSLSAVFHHIAEPRGIASAALVPEGGDSEELRQNEALSTALALARSTPSVEVVERASIAFEAAQPAAGDRKGIIPSMAARCVSVACAFDRLILPGPGALGVRPDQAMRLLVEHSGTRFDKKAVRLLASIVGVYPVGSLVRLSGGQIAVVVSAPRDPNLASRPTVRVVEEKGADASYLIELEREPNLAIVEALDARQERLNVTHFLLA